MEWDEGGMFGWAWCHYQPVREINICWWYSFNIYKTLVTGFPVTKLNKKQNNEHYTSGWNWRREPSFCWCRRQPIWFVIWFTVCELMGTLALFPGYPGSSHCKQSKAGVTEGLETRIPISCPSNIMQKQNYRKVVNAHRKEQSSVTFTPTRK